MVSWEARPMPGVAQVVPSMWREVRRLEVHLAAPSRSRLAWSRCVEGSIELYIELYIEDVEARAQFAR